MEYHGHIHIEHEMAGSKSEGDYAYLRVDEEHDYRLYAASELAVDSRWAEPFRDQQVVVEGEWEEVSNSICVNSIKPEQS